MDNFIGCAIPHQSRPLKKIDLLRLITLRKYYVLEIFWTLLFVRVFPRIWGCTHLQPLQMGV